MVDKQSSKRLVGGSIPPGGAYPLCHKGFRRSVRIFETRRPAFDLDTISPRRLVLCTSFAPGPTYSKCIKLFT